jgi:hypothetical protein
MRSPNRVMAALVAGGMIASTLAATPVAAQRVEVGNASTVVGDVKLSNAEITKPRKVERKQRLALGDLIDTGKKSQLQILLLDRSTFGIGASARVRIDRYVYDPDKGRSVFATFFKGALRFFSGREEGANSADIQTPSGRIGIRGTAADLLVGKDAISIAKDEQSIGKVKSNKDEATLTILRGPGPGTEGDLTPGRAEVEAAGVTVVLDQPGHAAYIPRNGAPPIGPFFISDQGLAKVQDELAPEVARAAKGGGGLLKALIPIAVTAITVGLLLNKDGDQKEPGQPGGQNPNPGQVPNQNNPCVPTPGTIC